MTLSLRRAYRCVRQTPFERSESGAWAVQVDHEGVKDSGNLNKGTTATRRGNYIMSIM